ncbi:hypothetical protein M9Y10_007714 [Tritrichomonas musculus]|uniref:Initiator binding domain-containing protein n=1 Tax=Tritrichomonas musculus TaxID=1915356 RepID=A0ABR2J301_9EUKA
MKNGKTQICIHLIKNAELNRVPITEQTQKIRNKINLKIRELGSKYYQIKGILDRMNIQRDTLFLIAKELEVMYKDQKKGIHIQAQFRRMKEALHCWFCENFYQEFTEPNIPFLNNIAILQYKFQKSSILTKKKNKADDKNRTVMSPKQNKEQEESPKNLDDALINETKILNEAKINQEMDSFELANIDHTNTTCYNEDLFNPFLSICFK